MTLELVLFNESEMYNVTSSETIYSFETILFSESTTCKTESGLKINMTRITRLITYFNKKTN